MTFKDWCSYQVDRTDGVGDLAQLVCRDDDFPDIDTDNKALYLTMGHIAHWEDARAEMMVVLNRAWAEFLYIKGLNNANNSDIDF